MDFTPTPEMVDAAGLAAQIFGDHGTPEHLRAIDASGDRFDASLWNALGESGLLGLGLPEEFGGAGLGMLELGAVLTEQGRALGAVPLVAHLVAGLAIARLAPDAALLADAASGQQILTVLRDIEPGSTDAFTAVPAATRATLGLVVTDDGVRLVRLAELTVEAQSLSTGEVTGRVVVPAGAGTSIGGADAARWVEQHLDAAQAAYLLGVCEGALTLTSEYAKTREQFERPIGTFQAVSQRLADGYIDLLGFRITVLQALWRLSAGLPSSVEVSSAALWAADTCHRLAHTTVHVHGGVGIDLDGEAHRYFTAAKVGEFVIGGTTHAALAIGRELANA